MPLNEYQRAFLKNAMVSKTNVIDPDTGAPVDFGNLGGSGLSEAEVQALIEAYAEPLHVPEDLGADGDDFEGTALDAAWVLSGGASASFLDDHCVSLALGSQSARMLKPYTPPTNVNARLLVRNISNDGGMTGLCLVDAAGDGLVVCAYQLALYAFNLTAYAYVSALISSGIGVGVQDAYWLELEKVGSVFRVRWTPDPEGLVNWSSWSGTGTLAKTYNRIGVIRAYTGGGAVSLKIDKLRLPV